RVSDALVLKLETQRKITWSLQIRGYDLAQAFGGRISRGTSQHEHDQKGEQSLHSKRESVSRGKARQARTTWRARFLWCQVNRSQLRNDYNPSEQSALISWA